LENFQLMLQRIQSFWLLIACAASLLTLKFPVYSGNQIGKDNIKTFVTLNAHPNLLILILTVINALMAFFGIFMYKNRKLQLRLAIFGIVFSIVNIVVYFFETRNFVPEEGKVALASIIALSIPVFFVLAARAIYGDEKLVRDSDRLR